MPTPKSEFPSLYPCDFYTPAELMESGEMYTVYEIARLLQGLDPDAEIDEGTEEVLLDWAIPWVMTNADDLVVAEPRTDEEPGYYGLKEGTDGGGATAAESEPTPPSGDADVDPNTADGEAGPADPTDRVDDPVEDDDG
ncbi:DUF5827 family protein [Candidatus Halobonum tyrrellensis]|uniref:Uncharacterized protein n=1 Tax=Candidatus Halobonum tyrrellensis G22 TaxID=1324957 RepID=V4GWF9_9EURY|nr:DUF5827 family protein [Candidatus Halobonum tyrrellensis]ESP89491.1 hypothetical protein K933_03670 [Candidatus Halobonum tyrrellensis G22]